MYLSEERPSLFLMLLFYYLQEVSSLRCVAQSSSWVAERDCWILEDEVMWGWEVWYNSQAVISLSVLTVSL